MWESWYALVVVYKGVNIESLIGFFLGGDLYLGLLKPAPDHATTFRDIYDHRIPE